MGKQIDHLAVREQVRTIYYANGRNLSEAARTANVPIDRAEKWKERGKWDVTVTKLDVSETVGRIADSLANEIAENNRETKLSLTRSARRMAKDSEQATLREAGLVHKVGQLHAILDPVEAKANTILNVAILTGQEEPERSANVRDI